MIVHPGIAHRAAGQMPCQVASVVFANQYVYHDNNKCLTVDGRFYAWESPKGFWRDCSAGDINGKVYETFKNTLYVLKSSFLQARNCKDFAAWQGVGQDIGSTVLPLPSVAEIISMAKAILA